MMQSAAKKVPLQQKLYCFRVAIKILMMMGSMFSIRGDGSIWRVY